MIKIIMIKIFNKFSFNMIIVERNIHIRYLTFPQAWHEKHKQEGSRISLLPELSNRNQTETAAIRCRNRLGSEHSKRTKFKNATRGWTTFTKYIGYKGGAVTSEAKERREREGGGESVCMVDSRPIRSGSRPLDTFFRSPLDSLWGLKPIGPSARAIGRKRATTATLLNVESVHFSSRLTRFAFDSLPPPFHDRIQPPWITRGAPFQSTAPVLSRGSPLLGQASTIFFNPWPPFSRSTNPLGWRLLQPVVV